MDTLANPKKANPNGSAFFEFYIRVLGLGLADEGNLSFHVLISIFATILYEVEIGPDILGFSIHRSIPFLKDIIGLKYRLSPAVENAERFELRVTLSNGSELIVDSIPVRCKGGGEV